MKLGRIVCGLGILCLLLLGNNVSACLSSESSFAFEVVLTKDTVTYSLTELQKISNMTYFSDPTADPKDGYLWHSHYNTDLGVVARVMTLTWNDNTTSTGLSLSFIIPTKGDEYNITLAPAVNLDPATFDWKDAVKVELNYLVNASVISGLSGSDIDAISAQASAGTSGQDYRLVYHGSDWVQYWSVGRDVYLGGCSFFPTLDKNFTAVIPPAKPPKQTLGAIVGSVPFGLAILVCISAVLCVVIYVRIKREQVLTNIKRNTIFDTIKNQPGIHFRDLMRSVGIREGVLAYHLNVLERDGFVRSMQMGQYRCFYPADKKSEYKMKLSLMQQNILKIVSSEPGITQFDHLTKAQQEPDARELSRAHPGGRRAFVGGIVGAVEPVLYDRPIEHLYLNLFQLKKFFSKKIILCGPGSGSSQRGTRWT